MEGKLTLVLAKVAFFEETLAEFLMGWVSV